MTPDALIGTAHFSISLFTNWPRYCGVMSLVGDDLGAERLQACRATCGDFIASTAAALSFATISAGAFFGRKIAFQV